MRIALLHDYNEDVGGAEVYFRSLVRLLEERGHEVLSLCGSSFSTPSIRYVLSAYNPVYRLRFVPSIRAFDPDVVHVHSMWHNISPSFLGQMSRMGLPILHTPHEVIDLPPIDLRRPWTWFSPLKKRTLMWFIREYVDLVLPPARFLANKLRMENGIQSILPLPLFVRLSGAQNMGAPANGKRIATYVGRLANGKGLIDLIYALLPLATALPDVELHIVGDGPSRAELQQAARKLGVDGNVMFHGWIPHNQVDRFYMKSDLVVLPSRIPEVFPLSIVEAMSHSCPVVTTSIGGQAELVVSGTSGITVPPGNPEALTAAMMRLLQNSDLAKQYGRNGRKLVETSYSSKVHGMRIEEAYEIALARQTVRDTPPRLSA